MTPLLSQFLTEAQDLVEAADASLLRLERRPDDEAALNGLFRAVHTLKGSASLFDDLPALIRLVHAAEDLLCAIRDGQRALTSAIVDRLLDALDVVKAWLESLARADALPNDAFTVSQSLSDTLRALIPGSDTGERTADPAPASTADAESDMGLPWFDALTEETLRAVYRNAAGGGEPPLLAITYTPDAQSFFSGEDPLHLVRQVPDLLALSIRPRTAWPHLDELDPYACALDFGVLSLAPRGEVEAVFRYIPDQVRIEAVPARALIRAVGEDGEAPVFDDFAQRGAVLAAANDTEGLAHAGRTLLDLVSPSLRRAALLRWLLTVLDGPKPDPVTIAGLVRAIGDGLPPRWRMPEPPATAVSAANPLVEVLLRDQLRLLSQSGEEGMEGRIASAGRTMANVLAAAGRDADAARAAEATATALAARSPDPLLALLDRLSPDAEPEAVQPPAEAASVGTNGDGNGRTRTLRVDQGKVDLLMNLIGELVVAKNGLPFLARRAEQVHGSREMARDLKDQYAVFDRLAQEMQGAIMQVRMLPVAPMFQRFPRLVRDLARKLGKSIDLVIEGEDTEADKTIIESLGDPLLHLVRNAIDHGVETPDERVRSGKPETATIRLKASQENDRVVIEVADDGHGIDPAAVKAKAVAKGLITAEDAAAMDEETAIRLVFRPGFSTAEAVTDLSGRGVGMDVVRTAVEKEGGRVALSSRFGQGTTIALYLPLSMAVSRVMMVEVGGQPFGIPMDTIAETVRVPRSRLRAIKRVETMLLRDAVVPVVRLRHLLGLGAGEEEREEEAILVVRHGDQSVGLVIDQFREGVDVILKPLDGVLAGTRGCGGTAILGDGRVLLVLNLKELL
jgi:two-component system, chemotaxis family, sensor kinase CheA